jgi:membrane-bound lytic murein transglycosylase B
LAFAQGAGGSTPMPTAAAPAQALVQPAAQEIDPSVLNGGAVNVGAGVQVDQNWLTQTSMRTQMDPRALQAYATAELAQSRDEPGCHLSWNTLAAIGWIESGHGTHAGASLQQDGRTTLPILGPALDGTQGHRAIPATDATSEATGDSEWDHAVGPMQFIGSTWAKWGTDASGDGFADPNNIDDAALTTARYLCASGRDLSTGEGWTAAVHSYNHSDDYVNAVRASANDFAPSPAG